MKNRKVLVRLEYEWRMFRLYRKTINRLIKMNLRLTSPVLCFFSRKLDKHEAAVIVLKRLYEKQTGEKIVFYKYYE